MFRPSTLKRDRFWLSVSFSPSLFTHIFNDFNNFTQDLQRTCLPSKNKTWQDGLQNLERLLNIIQDSRHCHGIDFQSGFWEALYEYKYRSKLQSDNLVVCRNDKQCTFRRLLSKNCQVLFFEILLAAFPHFLELPPRIRIQRRFWRIFV